MNRFFVYSQSCLIPYTEDYNIISVFATNEETIQIECEARNVGNNCAIRSCMVESLFVSKILRELFGGFDPDLKHDLGIFDRQICKNNVNVAASGNRHCCGNFPQRFPFRDLQGLRGCCGASTYNTDLYSCCDSSTSYISMTC